MDDDTSARTIIKHDIVNSLDREFARLHSRSCTIVESTPPDILYSGIALGSDPAETPSRSVGEGVLRCAATIEQTFGGITASLWDDPFEWTLPEYLSTPEKVYAYLEEVESTRSRAFGSFIDDGCLLKRIATPAGAEQALMELLLETLVRATYFQSQAAVTLKKLSGIGTPGLII